MMFLGPLEIVILIGVAWLLAVLIKRGYGKALAAILGGGVLLLALPVVLLRSAETLAITMPSMTERLVFIVGPVLLGFLLCVVILGAMLIKHGYGKVLLAAVGAVLLLGAITLKVSYQASDREVAVAQVQEKVVQVTALEAEFLEKERLIDLGEVSEDAETAVVAEMESNTPEENPADKEEPAKATEKEPSVSETASVDSQATDVFVVTNDDSLPDWVHATVASSQKVFKSPAMIGPTSELDGTPSKQGREAVVDQLVDWLPRKYPKLLLDHRTSGATIAERSFGVTSQELWDWFVVKNCTEKKETSVGEAEILYALAEITPENLKQVKQKQQTYIEAVHRQQLFYTVAGGGSCLLLGLTGLYGFLSRGGAPKPTPEN